jgi:hypothetical protein
MLKPNEVMSQERLDRFIDEAARFADYQAFGARDFDLSQPDCWVAYTRQSLEEQAKNDRLAEYLLTCARLAKEKGVVVPREYVIYDAGTSENMNRPGMIRLRTELIAKMRIAGVIIPALGRLSMDDLHRLTFEQECSYYRVAFIYGDAPSGMDIGSQFARAGMAIGNALRVKSNRDNVLAGNISRVMSGKVPAHRVPYGYSYRAEKMIDPRTGRARVLSASWELNEPGPDGKPIQGCPAWVVNQIFHWVGDEGRTLYWVLDMLNDMKIPAPCRSRWKPMTVAEIVRRKSYTGKGEYNAYELVSNPERPIGDPTLGFKKTLKRPKPKNVRVAFDVPPLTSEDCWQRANDALTERGRGRGKRGKAIQALFRGRMLCPGCQKPMAVLRDRRGYVYYHCRAHYCSWVTDPCKYNRFVPKAWDEEIYEQLCGLLNDDAWVEQQLTVEVAQVDSVTKLIRTQQSRIGRATTRIGKVQEGWERGLYLEAEAKAKIAETREAIAVAEEEIARLRPKVDGGHLGATDLEMLRQELRLLRSRNLENAKFEEKADLVAKLGIKVFPSEDLKSRRIECRLNLLQTTGGEEQSVFAKAINGGTLKTRSRRGCFLPGV